MFETLAQPEVTACPLGTFIGKLNDHDRDNLNAALESPIPNAAIMRAIAGEAGTKMSKDTIANHRKQVCRCSKL